MAADISVADFTNQSAASLPKLLAAYQKAIPGFDAAMLANDKLISPERAALDLRLAQQYSPEYAALANTLQDENTSANINRELTNLRGSGGQLVREGVNIDKEINPEYYATREAANAAYQKLLNSVNVDGLSTGESEEISRGLARSGELPGSQSWKYAQTFGNALNAKKDRLASVLSQAPALLSSRTSIDPFLVGTGRGGVSAGIVNPASSSGFANTVTSTGNALTNNAYQTAAQNAQLAFQKQQAKNQQLGNMINTATSGVNLIGAIGSL